MSEHLLICNYRDGPIGGYGCICIVVNKNTLRDFLDDIQNYNNGCGCCSDNKVKELPEFEYLQGRL